MELPLILAAISVLLVVVGLIQPLARRLRLSSSVLLAVVGVAIGFMAALTQAGEAGRMSGLFANLPIDSEAFLYIFLPILLFETALSIDVRRMMDDAAPILLLAVVAVLVATVVIGFAIAPMAGVPLVACLLLGSIVATTDPVAVVGIFRDLGAPARLRRLVEGESLLNDAAAITLFTILIGVLVEGGSIAAGEGALAFLRSFVGGIAVGAIGARLLVETIPLLRDLKFAKVTMTLALPYLVYVVGEHGMHVSGVVAVVTAGLVLRVSGQPRIAPDIWRFLEEFWGQVAFVASSLIFVLASILVPKLMTDIGWHDVASLAVLIAAALFARALVLFGLLPGLTALKLSGPVSNRFKAVIVWGGLRGAVTLALALAVTENSLIGPEIQRFIAVQATGFVLFTLLVNGTTLRVVIRLLRLDEPSPLDLALRNQVMTMSLRDVRETLDRTVQDYKISPEFAAAVTGQYENVIAELTASTDRAQITDRERIGLGLVALANRERELIRAHFEERTISTRIVELMQADAEQLVDRARASGRLGYIKAARRALDFKFRFRIAHLVHRWLRFDRLLSAELADRFEVLLVSRMILRELYTFLDLRMTPFLGERSTGILREILDQRRDAAIQGLAALRLQYPDYADALELRFLRRVAIRRVSTEYHDLFEEGLIGSDLHDMLDRNVSAAGREAEVRPVLDLGLDTVQLVSQVPLFAGLGEEQITKISRLLVPRLALPGERLIRRGDRGDAAYFVSSGALLVQAPGHELRLGRGDFFGELALITGQPRSSDVTAIGYCQLLVLSRADFLRLLPLNPDIQARVEQVAEERITRDTQVEAASHEQPQPGDEGSPAQMRDPAPIQQEG